MATEVIDDQTSSDKKKKKRIENNILFFHHHSIGKYTCIYPNTRVNLKQYIYIYYNLYFFPTYSII